MINMLQTMGIEATQIKHRKLELDDEQKCDFF